MRRLVWLLLVPVPYFIFSNLIHLQRGNDYDPSQNNENLHRVTATTITATTTKSMVIVPRLYDDESSGTDPVVVASSPAYDDVSRKEILKAAALQLKNIPDSDSNSKRGRLFYCGWDSAAQYLFPDYDYQGLWRPQKKFLQQRKKSNADQHKEKETAQGDTSRDILVIGLFGPCLGQRRFKISNAREIVDRQLFDGKVLYVNGEAYGGIIDPYMYTQQQFQIGPYVPGASDYHNHSLTVSFMVMYFGLMTIQELDNRTTKVGNAQTLKSGIVDHRSRSSNNFTTTSTASSLELSSSIWEILADPSRRPRTTSSIDERYEGVVYLAIKCLRFRQKAAQKISSIVPVYHGKGCKPPSSRTSDGSNNSNKTNGTTLDSQTIILLDENQLDNSKNTQLDNLNSRDGWQRNHKLYSHFKYCLVMENTAKDGYITEKLLNAFLGGCLPIYYGSTYVFEIFHRDAFIFYDVNDPQRALDRLRYLEDNPNAYEEIMHKPILQNGRNTLETYFSIFPNLGNGTLNKRLRIMMGLGPLESAISDSNSGRR
jgi:Glycosyltransferase family 10 (fucosyltransferase) C-term